MRWARTAHHRVLPGDRADGTPKDTARNIRLTHEFVVNLVDETVAEAMNRTAAALPYGVSELQSAGLTTAVSSAVKPPRIAESPGEFGMQGMGNAADWQESAHHRVGEARAGG